MPIVSTCPKCDAPVTVPDGVDPAAKVKCPLCDAPFELNELLESLPPMLEILEQPPSRPARPAAAAAPAAAPAVAAVGSGGEADDEALFGDLSVTTDGDDTEDIGDMFAIESDEPKDTTADSGSGFGGIDFGDSSDDGENAGGAATPTEGAAALDTGSAAAPASLASKTRPKRKGPNPIFHLVGIAGFGVLGLVIGYVILVMIKGEQGDFLGVRKYMPSFIYSADDGASNEDIPPELVQGEPKKSKKKSKKNGNGGSFKKPKDGEELSSLNFDFDNPDKGKKPKGGKRNGRENGSDEPISNPVGPTALKETLRFNIEDAVDDVAVKAAALAAEQEKSDTGAETGDDGKINDLGRAVRDHYFALSHLGLTMAAAKEGSLDDEDLVDRIRKYVRNSVQKMDTYEGIGKKALIWLNYDQVVDDEGKVVKKGRQDRNGILIAGTIRSVGLGGGNSGLYTARVQIAGTDESITVVGPGNPPNAGGPMLFLGAIIENPAENLAGYQGDKQKVVWLCMAVNKPEPGDPVEDLDPPSDEPDEEPAIDEAPAVELKDLSLPAIDSGKVETP
ncbi:MAG: hypothetical protein MI757_20735 [Pirellulales bacterium]|nr:hypothetical protein [Pirellulales bacterium]